MQPKNNRQLKTQKAFTLIELLVVIAIVGILAGLAVVNMSGATEAARIAKLKVFSNSVNNSLLANRVSEWRFDEVSGSVATDTVGTSNGTLTNNPTRKSGADCVSGGCLEFNGTSNYVVSANNAGSSGDFAATISAWAKFNSLNNSGYHTLVSFGQTGTLQGFALSQFTPDSSVVRVAFFGGVANTGSTASGAVTTGQWYHFVATKTPGAIGAGTTKLYINGILQSLTFGTSATPSMIDGKLYVGSDAASEYSNSAIVDEVRIYNSALTASVIREQYLAGLDKLLASNQITEKDYQQRISKLNLTYAANE